MKFLYFLAPIIALSAPARAADFPVPPDANVINVRDFGAIPDDGVDDTAAIQTAIAKNIDGPSRYRAPKMIYLPDGVYNISGPLEARVGTTGWSNGWRAGFVLFGQSRDKTILKLADNADGFGDAAKPRAVLVTGSENDKGERPEGGGNRAFRHSIRNLTLDTGKGNVGAVGIDYVVSNRGTIHGVTVRSGDGAGHAGILMTRPWPGPCLIKDVAIDGFDHGFRVAHYQYGVAFEHIRLENQKVAGIENIQNILAIRDLQSRNRVPAIVTLNNSGQIVLVDSNLSGGDPDGVAIQSRANLFVRNLSSSGYGTIINNQVGTKENVAGGAEQKIIAQYLSQAADSPAQTSLALPIEETPTYDNADFKQWANVANFGARPYDKTDDTAAIQAAIDAGKPVVYLPNGGYSVSKTIVIRGNVRKLVGFESSISTPKDFVGPTFRFEGKNTTVLEHLYFDGIEHAGSGALAMSHCDVRFYSNTEAGTGKAFFEDVMCKPLKILHPQKVWARRLNSEFGEAPLVENHGGTLWILLCKTEGQMVCLRNVGGTTEVLGGIIYPLRKVPEESAIFVNEGGRLSVSFSQNGSPRYPALVREIRDGGTTELTPKEVKGRSVGLYLSAP